MALHKSIETVSAPRAVVFDLDGLMFNTEEIYHEVGAEVLRRRGKAITGDLLDAMMGRPPRMALQIMIDRHGLIDDTVERLAAESMQVFAGMLDGRLAPMPGLVDLLTALEQAKIPKAVATSSTRNFVDDVLGRFDFHSRFEFILTSEDVVHGKPHPETYLIAAQRLQLSPPEVLVLEDSHNGCTAAAAAGTFAVAVPAGRSKGHDFSMASLVIDSLEDRRLYEALRLTVDNPGSH